MRSLVPLPVANLLLFVVAFVACCGFYSECCELPLRFRFVNSTWQTSVDQTATACFHGRSSLDELATVGTGSYFRTGASVGTLHWFAVKFAKPLPLASVTIVPNSGGARILSGNIEVWISNSNQLDFGPEHCSTASEKIYQVFRAEAHRKRCTIVQSVDTSDSESSSENYTAVCEQGAQARFLILLKENNDRMGFADLLLQLHPDKDEKRSVPANSNFTVDCSESCSRRFGSSQQQQQQQQQQLCLPNGTCLSAGRIDIGSASRVDSGRYTCRGGDNPTGFSELIASVNLTVPVSEKFGSPKSSSMATSFVVIVTVLAVAGLLVAAGGFAALRVLRQRRQFAEMNPAERNPPMEMGVVGTAAAGTKPSTSSMLPDAYAEIYCDA